MKANLNLLQKRKTVKNILTEECIFKNIFKSAFLPSKNLALKCIGSGAYESITKF
jgi:hypothetical protein